MVNTAFISLTTTKNHECWLKNINPLPLHFYRLPRKKRHPHLSPVRLFKPSVKSDWNSGDCNFIVNRECFRRHSLLQLQPSNCLRQGSRHLSIWRESHQPRTYKTSKHAQQ